MRFGRKIAGGLVTCKKKACQKRVFRGSWENCPGYVIFLLLLPPPLFPGRNSSSPPHLPYFTGGEQSKALKKIGAGRRSPKKKKILTSPPFPAQGKKIFRAKRMRRKSEKVISARRKGERGHCDTRERDKRVFFTQGDYSPHRAQRKQAGGAPI